MEEGKMWTASLHLDGVAAEWYYALERDHGILAWARFVNFVYMRFGPPLQTNGLAELKELYRTGTVEDYQQQFSLLLCRSDDLTPLQQANLFTAGLGEPIHTEVELHAPDNLQTIMSLAQEYEHKEVGAAEAKGKGPFHPPTSSTKGGAAGIVAKAAATNRTHFKRLMMEELANGECYSCIKKLTAIISVLARGCSY
jgi:hypothetical protein